jgi:hypothetical protein
MSRIAKLLTYASLAKRQSGKSRLRQFLELVRLTRGRWRLGVQEYYEFELFDGARFSATQQHNCVGWRASMAIDRRLNHDYWRATANDKVLNYALLLQYGFPIPVTLATFSPAQRRVGPEKALANVGELENFLTQQAPFPLFVKPIHGTYGRGTYLLEAYDAAAQRFRGAHGTEVALAELLSVCQTPQFGGMLFQRPLVPQPEVLQWAGASTSCVRVIVALTSQGPKVHMAFWKIARAHNITDNFHMGATGNLLAWIDKDSGRVTRVVTGLWPNGQDVSRHPDTGQELLGKTLPDWPRAMAMCLSASHCFPGLRLQHWDVAFCREGPVLMELNTEADLGVPQALGRTPFVDATIAGLMAIPGAD